MDLKLEILVNTHEEVTNTIIGGDDTNPTWEEYLENFQEEGRPYLKLLRETIITKGLLGMTGEDIQRKGYTFKFSDGVHIDFTWRAWGDLMQAIVNKKEGYMKYYM